MAAPSGDATTAVGQTTCPASATDGHTTRQNRCADLRRHLPHGRGIIHPEMLHIECEHVAAFVTHEAIEHLFFRDDREVSLGATVKRTRPPKIRAGAPEIDMFAYDVHDVRRIPNLLDHFVGNRGHDFNSATVTPQPP